MTLKQWVQSLVDNEKPVNILVLKDDAMCELLIAWQALNVDFCEIANCKNPEAESWQHSVFDYNELALLSGLPVGECRSALRRLWGLRLLYPDGTINKFASQYLNAKTKKLLKDMNK